jgi:Zn-dependent protease
MELIIFILSLIVSITVHEFMHAYVGYKLGDTTARDEGRLSFNPLKHIDPVMTVALPIITFLLFKAPILVAKPVPFTPWLVRYREKGAALLAVAGPLSNLVLAAFAAVIARGFSDSSLPYQILFYFSQLNIGLFLFNLIPLPPLDGSRVLYAFVPQSVRDLMDQIEPYGFFVIFMIVALGGFGGLLNGAYSFIMNLLF